MTATSRKTLKTSIVAGATALIASAFTPAASADAVDDMLAKMPSGPISCEQANKYWTSEADFQSKKKQALAVATFHPRGGEIRAAIGRIDEAANRCGLRGTTGSKPSAPKPAPKPSAPKQNTTAPKPSAPKPAPKKPVQRSTKPVYKVFVSPGMPTFDVPVANVATVRLPDVAEMAQDALAGGSSLPQGSSLPR
ncbi:hypothetical protein H0194_06035 [Corynebacterium incognita]|uniref:Secreted protein n=1 Tax=Corynebacterium incognita TaxID=2754725 RepID=A0A7G7CM55_9CORY|nr:hypothetical protein [Corynebacterium incognita]QNE88671.1 hypothetical protein H0194_06035 [Corynebacterium incognita]